MGKNKSFKGFAGIDLRKFATRALTRFFMFALPYAVSIGFTVTLLGASYAFALQSELFTLKQVTTESGRILTPQAALRFSGLRIGTPILDIDLAEVERTLYSRNPELKNVLVRRVLPDQIQLVLRRRVPIAQIQTGSYYLVDGDGVVISEASSIPFGPLPVIQGFKDAHVALRKGARLDRYSVNQGIQLLKDMQKFDVLHGHQLTALDVSNQTSFVMWVDEKIEVRIAARNFTAQLKKVSDVLSSIDLDPEKIKYIDLRFDDVVIGPR